MRLSISSREEKIGFFRWLKQIPDQIKRQWNAEITGKISCPLSSRNRAAGEVAAARGSKPVTAWTLTNRMKGGFLDDKGV